MEIVHIVLELAGFAVIMPFIFVALAIACGLAILPAIRCVQALIDYLFERYRK